MGHRPLHGPALFTADSEVTIVFEAFADARVQAKYRAFDSNFDRRRPVTRNLRADEARAAPADRVAIAVEGDRPTRPIAAWASHRMGFAVAPVRHIARLWRVVARLAVGDSAADDSSSHDAAEDAGSDPAAIAPGIRSGRGAHGSRGDSRRRRDRKNGLL